MACNLIPAALRRLWRTRPCEGYRAADLSGNAAVNQGCGCRPEQRYGSRWTAVAVIDEDLEKAS
jgi:hypothetical protein